MQNLENQDSLHQVFSNYGRHTTYGTWRHSRWHM